MDHSLVQQSGLSRDSVSQYLQLRPDQSVLILHAKVAQKSYGNEKRGLGDSGCRVCGYMALDNTGSAQVDTFKLTFEDQPGSKKFACAKALYISDADKRKHFRLVLKLFFSNGQEIGSFYSKLIKVISKPSQKKQSMKNADRSKVSLFNRLRSQTVSTRYLAVEGGAFVASARQWAAFTVTLVDEQQTEQGEYSLREGYICYGCVLQLVCTVTGVALPPMWLYILMVGAGHGLGHVFSVYTRRRELGCGLGGGERVSVGPCGPAVIRKVNKQHAILDVDEPVSQLHKCAFQFKDSDKMYLCLSNEKIIQYQADACQKDPGRELLNDGSCWTIIGTETMEYTFSESLASLQTAVTPIPIISALELNGGGHVAMLEIHGENFGPHLRVWSPKSMLCVVPDVSVFSREWRWLRRPITVPLSLVRADGLIYSSTFSFTYTPEHTPPPPPAASPECPADSDSLIDSIHQEFTRTNFHLFMQS
ncbi:hypothetical protein JZ751_018014 [Albula glossodonta]|uniref:Recombining binding protein suppressor of hairless-like protein n=1 Tax=Albula glossodonta TaxID=121402 RepID=A0A8T2PQ25_9TELE|nr:hypothetical protein JZ751_018014 [Albula glossodonta]